MFSSRRLALLMLLLGACERPEALPARLQGRVLDVEGAPVAGARVRVGSAVTSTRADGTFFVLDLPADTPLTVEVQSSGYSSWQDLRYLPPDVWSYVDANVAPVERVRLEDASKGGVVETSTGLRLQFPPGAVQDATGALVTGPVTVAVAHLDEPHEVVAAPGGLLVMGALGGQTRERSWGLAEITLTANSQPAQLARPVVLSMPLAAAWEDEPLRLTWLNPETSRWEEIADVRIQDGRGLVTVEHFSWYGVGREINDEACLSLALTGLDKSTPLSVRVIANDTSEGKMHFYGDFTVGENGQVQLEPLEEGTYDLRLTYGPYSWSLSQQSVTNATTPNGARQCAVIGTADMEDVRLVDADGDGFPTPTDCQDENMAGNDKINPAAEEDWYDGVDQDCSGGSDYDQDGDGDNCVPNSVNNGCDKNIPNSDDTPNGDCDDQNYKRSSRRKEVCDFSEEESYEGLDNDCDEYIDEEALYAKTWFIDEDGDGFGVEDGVDGKDPVVSCDQPDGMVEKSGDCDDEDPCAYPGSYFNDPRLSEDCAAQYKTICETGGEETTDLNCDGTLSQWDSDDDSDGATICGGDCNDADGSVHPEAGESCNYLDDNCNGEIDENLTILWYADSDGDGYGDDAISRYACDNTTDGWVNVAGDCDDLNPLIYPERQEICDDLDNDCDGRTDDDDDDVDLSTGTMFYIDADGDTFGAAEWGLACAPPPMSEGVVTNNDDCYDVDRGIYPKAKDVNPAAREICDEIDNNCDGLADDQDPGVDLSTGTTFFADLDGDGYGDLNNSRKFCAIQEGFLTNDEDCYDVAPEDDPLAVSVYPGAEEVCDDGFVNDCEPSTAYESCLFSGAVDLSVEGIKFVGEIGDDFAGASVSSAGDVDGDGLPDVLIGAGRGDSNGGNSGTVYLFRTSGRLKTAIPGDNIPLSEADLKITGHTAIQRLGNTMASAGDVNGDGLADIALGGPLYYEDYGDSDASNNVVMTEGNVYVLLSSGTLKGSGTMSVADAEYYFVGDTHDALLGGVAAGQIDGDGLSDVIVGAPGVYGSSTYNGLVAVMLSSGALASAYGTYSIDDADYYFVGENIGDRAGHSADLADYDGDGLNDLLISATNHDGAAMDAGAVYLLFGDTLGGLSKGAGVGLAAADLIFDGVHADDRAGACAASAGDVDGDGEDDMLVGAAYEDSGATDAGAYYLLYSGGSLGTMTSGDRDSLAVADLVIHDTLAGVNGVSVGRMAGGCGRVGDVDGDGRSDLMLTAYSSGSPETDVAYTYLLLSSGALSGGSTALTLQGDADANFPPADADECLGCAVSGAGDVNGDGLDDILIGAVLDDAGGTNAGAAYLLFGRSY
jgi:hypothetical protein